LVHNTVLAASSQVMPGHTPTTSTTGASAARVVATGAGHFTLPRAFSATSSAEALPEGGGTAAPVLALPAGSLEPQAATSSAVIKEQISTRLEFMACLLVTAVGITFSSS
jgi:hypothetical protein